MKGKLLAFMLGLSLLLAGCSWMEGSYASVEPYMEESVRDDKSIVAVSDYRDIYEALCAMVESCLESRTLSLADFSDPDVAGKLDRAVKAVKNSNPVGAYAVEEITYELGTAGGVSAVVITVEYNHNRNQVKNIWKVQGMDTARSLIQGALDRVDAEIVLRISDYSQLDFTQLVQDYALSHPDKVMEVPEITATVYPQSGTDRILELQFNYQTSRESLRYMQSYVRPRFTSAVMFVSGEDEAATIYSKLYAFLMETSEYTLQTSLTPAYSLLRHSVGDSKAFATVYAAICARANLPCLVVTGTRDGEPWTWNIICEDGVYYHLDLYHSSLAGGLQKLSDGEMTNYVWDYASYPSCGVQEEEPTEPTQG